MKEPLVASIKVDAQVICYYFDKPHIRPFCEKNAVIAFGPIAVCPCCNQLRSTLGKGEIGKPIPPPRDPHVLRLVQKHRVIRDQAEVDLESAVAASRTAGYSWTEIAATIGVTRQAAQQRYAKQ